MIRKKTDILEPEWKACKATVCCDQAKTHFECHVNCKGQEVGQLDPYGIIAFQGQTPESSGAGDYQTVKALRFTLTPVTTCSVFSSPQQNVKADLLDCKPVQNVRVRWDWDGIIKLSEGNIEQVRRARDARCRKVLAPSMQAHPKT